MQQAIESAAPLNALDAAINSTGAVKEMLERYLDLEKQQQWKGFSSGAYMVLQYAKNAPLPKTEAEIDSFMTSFFGAFLEWHQQVYASNGDDANGKK